MFQIITEHCYTSIGNRFSFQEAYTQQIVLDRTLTFIGHVLTVLKILGFSLTEKSDH